MADIEIEQRFLAVTGLAQAAGALALRYFGIEPQTGTPVWQQEWNRDAASLPKLIEISVSRKGSALPSEPAIIALRLVP
jgi:hypothetical protein